MPEDAAPDVPGAPSLAGLRQRLDRIGPTLAAAAADPATADREALRAEILALFHQIQREIDGLVTLQEAMRPLVDRYKEIFPKRAAAPAKPPRVDHLGSSTYRERGWSAFAGGDDGRAVRELRRALELAPGETGASALLAWALTRLGEYEEAGSLLASVLEREPDHLRSRLALGYLELRQGQHAAAADRLAAVLATGTDRTATMYANLYLGMLHSESGTHGEAQSYLRRALELGPNLTEAYWELGTSQLRDGRPDLALEAWRAGGSNPFNTWGERCREAADGLVATDGATRS